MSPSFEEVGRRSSRDVEVVEAVVVVVVLCDWAGSRGSSWTSHATGYLSRDESGIHWIQTTIEDVVDA